MSNDAAGFASATDRMIASPKGAFDAGLRPDPFPDQAASLLPGRLAATRTGLTPASDDELETRTSPQRDHLLITGRTDCSTNGASPRPDKACRRSLPIRAQAIAGTRGQVGRPPPLAAPMNCDLDAKCVCAGQVRCRCAVEREPSTLRRRNPFGTSTLTQDSGFAGCSFLRPFRDFARSGTSPVPGLRPERVAPSGQLNDPPRCEK